MQFRFSKLTGLLEAGLAGIWYPIRDYFSPPTNYIINGSCRVGQRTAPNLSTTPQYGKVDRFACWATGTAVSAGTIDQGTGVSGTTSGYTLKLAGVTVTGTGVLYARYRMEMRDAVAVANQTITTALLVRHNVGSSVNCTVTVNTATATDNFSSTTNVSATSATAVPTGSTFTRIPLVFSSGNVANGLELEIKVECGAVTGKDFEFADIGLWRTAYVPATYGMEKYGAEFETCRRYYRTQYGHVSMVAAATGNNMLTVMPLTPPMRTTPSVVFGSTFAEDGVTGHAINVISSGALYFTGSSDKTGYVFSMRRVDISSEL